MEPYTEEEKADFEAQKQGLNSSDILLSVEDFINNDLFVLGQQRQVN